MGWVIRFAAAVPHVISIVVDAIDEARKDDGIVSPDEAEAIARDVSALDDFVKVKIRGVDIVGPDAQADLFAALARIAARAENARRRS